MEQQIKPNGDPEWLSISRIHEEKNMKTLKTGEKFIYVDMDVVDEYRHGLYIFPKEVWQAETALDTQSMLELQQQYCAKKRCLECTVGHHILREPEMINTFCFQEIV